MTDLAMYDRYDPSGAELTLGEGRSADGTAQLILDSDDGHGSRVLYSLDAEAVLALAALMLSWAAEQLPEVAVPNAREPIYPRETVGFGVRQINRALDALTPRIS